MKNKFSSQYIIATHAGRGEGGYDVNGPCHTIFEELTSLNKNVKLISHPLDPKNNTVVVVEHNGGGLVDRKSYELPVFLPAFVRYVYEVAFNVWCILNSRMDTKRIIFIGIDPLNALSGVVAKVVSRKLTVIFYSVDYIEIRFNNKYINYIYHAIEYLCVRLSNHFWVVSSRIGEKLDSGSKPLLVPNSPSFRVNPEKAKKYDGNQNCIMAGYLNEYIDYPLAIKAVAILAKSHPQIRLLVAGEGPDREKYQNLVRMLNVEDKIEFIGYVDHGNLMLIYERCFLGLALYSGIGTWNRYGDSMKAREYMAKGLPVIITDIPSTADDVASYGSGIILTSSSPERLASHIDACIKDTHYYLSLKANTIKCAEAYDKSKIINQIIKNIEQ